MEKFNCQFFSEKYCFFSEIYEKLLFLSIIIINCKHLPFHTKKTFIDKRILIKKQ